MGGGSGGHVTPVIAVAREILKQRPRAKIEFWTDKKYYQNVRKLAVENGLEFRTRKIAAGKLRRYTNFTFVTYLQHFDVVLQNIADFFRIIAGFWQSFWRLVFNRPDIIFLKGGYVCLPVGMTARLLRIPYIIHDSDAVPDKYPEEKAVWTGIPIGEEFKPASEAKQKAYKKELGFDERKPLVVLTGGSLGAEHINLAVREILPELLKSTSVLLVAGRERYPEMLDLKDYEVWEEGELKSNFRMLEFSSEMWKLFGAADIVVSRAGASTMTELSSMQKAVIMVPNAILPGHHQVKNAETYAEEKAAIVVDDEKMNEDPQLLMKAIKKLLRDADLRAELAQNLKGFSKDHVAENIANIILENAASKSKD